MDKPSLDQIPIAEQKDYFRVLKAQVEEDGDVAKAIADDDGVLWSVSKRLNLRVRVGNMT